MRRRAARIVVALCAAGVAACGSDPAADYAEGMRLLRASPADTPHAAAYLQRAADGGSAPAAYRYAQLLRQGPAGVGRHPAQAVAYLRIAAQAKLPQAEFLLGQMLLAGEGVERDPRGARHWFERAADHELPEANLELAMAGQRGELGITRDDGERYLMEAGHALRHRPPEP